MKKGQQALTLLMSGADGRTRTVDLRITNALLYQLSYTGVPRANPKSPRL